MPNLRAGKEATERLFWAVLFSFVVVSTSGTSECKGNGRDNQSIPTLCEAAIGYPLDLVSTVCIGYDLSSIWYILRHVWQEVSRSDHKFHLDVNFTDGTYREAYKCVCQNDESNSERKSFFQVDIKPGVSPAPSTAVKKNVEMQKEKQFFLYPDSPELSVLDMGRICISVNSTGWPTPTYSWYMAYHNGYLPYNDKVVNPHTRCYTGNNSKQATEQLCIFPSVDLLRGTDWPVQLMCEVHNLLGNITYFVNVTSPELSSDRTPSWFLRPHEAQSFGLVPYNESGIATAYCGAYTDRENVTVQYRLCDVTASDSPSPCSLEPNDKSSDFFCYSCARQSPGVEITMDKVPLYNSIGMVTKGCRVTMQRPSSKAYACMARRVSASDERDVKSDYQMLGYFEFKFANSSPSANVAARISEACSVGLAVIGGLLLLVCLALCVVCSCCCCYYCNKFKAVKGREDGKGRRAQNLECSYDVNRGEIVDLPGDDERVEIENDGNGDRQEAAEDDNPEDRAPLLRPQEGRCVREEESGYGSTAVRCKVAAGEDGTWPLRKPPTTVVAEYIVTVVNTKTSEVIAKINLTSQLGKKQTPPSIYLPLNTKYYFSISGIENSFVVFTGKLDIPQTRGNQPYSIASGIPIPSTIEDSFPFKLKDVLDFLPKIAMKWFEIGTHLDLGNQVRELNTTAWSNLRKLTTILQEWEESGKGVSWQTLVNVLETKAVDLGAVAKEIKEYLYDQVPIVPDNIDFLQPLTLNGLMHLVVRLAPHWRTIGTRLKFGNLVNELKRPSCKRSDLVKMTVIFDEWNETAKKEDLPWLNWLNLLDVLNPEYAPELAEVKEDIEQHIRDRVMWSKKESKVAGMN